MRIPRIIHRNPDATDFICSARKLELELLFQHFHEPVCQVILRRSRVHQTFCRAEAKPRAESLSIDHAGVRPVEPDLANAFQHNTPRRAVQLEFPTYDVRVWEQVAELKNQLWFGNKSKLDGFGIARNLSGARCAPWNSQFFDSKIGQSSGVEDSLDLVPLDDIAQQPMEIIIGPKIFGRIGAKNGPRAQEQLYAMPGGRESSRQLYGQLSSRLIGDYPYSINRLATWSTCDYDPHLLLHSDDFVYEFNIELLNLRFHLVKCL